VQSKLLAAGASGVISPNKIGGLRMVSEMIRPSVVSFLDLMLRDKEKNLRVEEVVVSDAYEGINKPIKDNQIRKKTGLLILALKKPNEAKFIYNPSSEELVLAGSVLIVVGDVSSVNKLRKLVQ
jgi:voltage-gated potassium channel